MSWEKMSKSKQYMALIGVLLILAVLIGLALIRNSDSTKSNPPASKTQPSTPPTNPTSPTNSDSIKVINGINYHKINGYVYPEPGTIHCDAAIPGCGYCGGVVIDKQCYEPAQ